MNIKNKIYMANLNVKFGFSIFDMFSEVLLNLFTQQIKRIKHFWNCITFHSAGIHTIRDNTIHDIDL